MQQRQRSWAIDIIFFLSCECLSFFLHEILIVFQPSRVPSATNCRVRFGDAARMSCAASSALNGTATGAACGSTWITSVKWTLSTHARTVPTEPDYPPCWSTTLSASTISPGWRRNEQHKIVRQCCRQIFNELIKLYLSYGKIKSLQRFL